MTHARHRRGSWGWGQSGWGFALGVLGVAFAATIPLGSVGFMATMLVAAMTWTVGVIGLTFLRPRGGVGERVSRPAAVAVMTLVVWCGWQLCPLPEGWVSGVWRGDAALLQQIAADGHGLTIAVDPFVSVRTGLLWSGLGVLAWACSRQLRGRTAVPVFLYGLMALGVIQSVMGIFFLKSIGGRVCGTFGSPDALGGLLAMTLPVTLGIVFCRSNQHVLRGRTGFRWWLHRLGDDWRAWRGPALWSILGIQMAGLYFTGSRGAALAAMVAGGVLWIWQAKERPESRVLLFSVGAVLAALAVIISLHARSQNVMDRVLGDASNLQQSKASRVEIWRTAARLCLEFPQGTGAGGTALVMPMYQAGSYGRFRMDFAHNDMLQFLGDLGPVGFGALAFLLGMTLWRGAKACRKMEDREDGSIWLRRGAWLAVVAALLHAQVDFNLSARPGIQVVFVILCGMLWGYRAGDCVQAGELAAPSRRGRRMGVLGVACLWLVGGGAVALSLATAWAWRLHEGVASVTGLALDENLWFARPAVKPEEASSVLNQAIFLAPGFSLFHRTLAEVQLAQQDKKVQQTARSLLVDSGVVLPPGVPLDPQIPAHAEALQLSGLAQRVEEKEMLRVALKEANLAVRLAPWDARSRLVRGNILIRGAEQKPFGEDVDSADLRDLEIAVRLYPLDAGVLADACVALSHRKHHPQDLEYLVDWGVRALALDVSLSWTILDSWWTGKVPVARILEMPNLPVSVLWRLYTLLDKQNQTEIVRQCLVALEKSLSRDHLPEESALWSPSMWKSWNIQQTQYRSRLTSEWLKRYLLDGDWAGVEALAKRRAEALYDRFQVELDKMELNGPSSVVMQRLRLREWEAGGELAPEWIFEWCLLELDTFMPTRRLQEPLAEMLLLDELQPKDRVRLEEHRAALTDVPFLAALLDAQTSEAIRRPEETASALAVLLKSGTVPTRFVHRVWLWQAKLLRQAGLMAAAEDALRAAALACPTDPEVEAALLNLGEAGGGDLISEKPKLNIGFMGRRLVLMNVGLEMESEPAKGRSLHLRWRFRGGLPPDLQMDVRILDGAGRLLVRNVAKVDQEESANYNRGNPPVGSSWTWTIPLPAKANQGRRVVVYLISAAKTVPSDEGLVLLELNMEKLPLVP